MPERRFESELQLLMTEILFRCTWWVLIDLNILKKFQAVTLVDLTIIISSSDLRRAHWLELTGLYQKYGSNQQNGETTCWRCRIADDSMLALILAAY